ncbi:MAG: aminodeoxychorismate synthase component I [Xanthomonadales bacterium]|nr:aminodeoxychorismate synthase component I [Xanthomonadales bacterium]
MSLTRQLPELPDLTGLHRQNPEKYPHYLSSAADSVLNHPNERFSMLFLARGETLELSTNGQLHGPDELISANKSFLSALDDWFQHLKVAFDSADSLPFYGGWFVFLGYEIAAEVEPVLDLPDCVNPTETSEFPVAFAQRCPAAIIIDHNQGNAWLVAEKPELLEEMQADLVSTDNSPQVNQLPDFTLCVDPDERYLAAVASAIEYIHAGDVFQVNLSRAWNIQAQQNIPEPMAILEALQTNNPAPFAGLSIYRQQAIISSSPERLLEINGPLVQARPIAGTRPRSSSAADDKALLEELINHPKERSEHIMLIDLVRNDLGRVCETGSVQVDELMVVEQHPHVHHIVSNIRGKLKPVYSPIDAIRAIFPGGTITGCPKVRCMQIIAELEHAGRGVYTGSMGYLSRNGNLDMNILIRSLFQQGKKLVFRTGGGIVADSEPEAELRETEAKAKGLLLALGLSHA